MAAVTWKTGTLFAGGLLLGAAIGGWAVIHARNDAQWDAGKAASSTAAMGNAPAQWSAPATATGAAPSAPTPVAAAISAAADQHCDTTPIVARAAGDGQETLQSTPQSATAAEVAALILAGKEAAAAGHPRDAEVNFLNACRHGEVLQGDATSLADSMYQLGRLYAGVAAGGGGRRDELLQRAQRLYSVSLQAYRARYGDKHEKTRFAAQGLAAVEKQGGTALAAKSAEPARQDRPVAVAPPVREPQKPVVVAPPPVVAKVEPAPAALPPAPKMVTPPPVVAKVEPAPAPRAAPKVASAPPVVVAPAVVATAPAAASERKPVAPPREAVVASAPRNAPAPATKPAAAPARPPVADRADDRPGVASGTAGTAVARSAGTRTTQPSFDCRRARSASEKIICSDEELARLDRDLGRLHARAEAAAPNRGAFRRQNDAEWSRRERDCQDRDCVRRWYSERRAQLEDGEQRAETQAPGTAEGSPGDLR